MKTTPKARELMRLMTLQVLLNCLRYKPSPKLKALPKSILVLVYMLKQGLGKQEMLRPKRCYPKRRHRREKKFNLVLTGPKKRLQRPKQHPPSQKRRKRRNGLRKQVDTQDTNRNNVEDAVVDNVEERKAGEVEKEEVVVVRVEDTEVEEVEKGDHLMVKGGAHGVEVREDEERETTTVSHLLPFEKNIREYCTWHLCGFEFFFCVV
jgi:hypothetical protein